MRRFGRFIRFVRFHSPLLFLSFCVCVFLLSINLSVSSTPEYVVLSICLHLEETSMSCTNCTSKNFELEYSHQCLSLYRGIKKIKYFLLLSKGSVGPEFYLRRLQSC